MVGLSPKDSLTRVICLTYLDVFALAAFHVRTTVLVHSLASLPFEAN